MKQQNAKAVRTMKSVIIGLAIATACGAGAFGQNIYTYGANDGSWFTSNHWSLGSIPVSSNNVLVNIGNGPVIHNAGSGTTAYALSLAIYDGSGVVVDGSNTALAVGNSISLGNIIGSDLTPGRFTVQNLGSASVGAGLTANYGSLVQLNNGELYLGTSAATFNRGSVLQVTAGGYLVADQLIFNNSSTGTVTGADIDRSEVVINELYVGNTSGGNSLTIANGGYVTVNSAGTTYVGYTNSSYNTLVVNNGTLDDSLADLYVGRANSSFNSLVISNGGVVINQTGYIGYDSTSLNNSVLVRGSGSVWTNASDLYVGYSGAGNSLTISNGGDAYNDNAYIGYHPGASNNSVVVESAGSQWAINGELIVGRSDASNSLTIQNGGVVTVTSNSAYIGYYYSSSNNIVTVTGSNSQWNITNDLLVGRRGGSNTLNILNGGLVSDSNGFIGERTSDSMNNAVLVSGSGSVWNNSTNLYVGYNGANNSLTVSNGGSVFSANGHIGYNVSSSNNSVLVTGTNSAWQVASTLTVGGFGANNNLTITDAGSVVVGGVATVYIGSNGNNNSVLVNGGSLNVASASLNLGWYGQNNSLLVTNSGVVFVGNNLTVGRWGSSSNNTLTITGSGSTVTVASNFSLGLQGINNHLSVLNGGRLLVGADSIVGGPNAYLTPESSGNIAVVDGKNSQWLTAGFMYFGLRGSDNQLQISNGGSVGVSNAMYIGSFSSSSNNTVLVTGYATLGGGSNQASALNVAGNLYIGNSGAGNSLTITNSGHVENADGYIGRNESSSNNSVMVTGSGSQWINNGDLTVGNSGANNHLIIVNGGYVEVRPPTNTTTYIGRNESSSNNTVLVDNGTWSNYCDLIVGSSGAGNTLTIMHSGTVFSVNGYIGENSSASNNAVIVTGNNSVWNTGTNAVGGDGSGNTLTITNGGKVSTIVSTIGYGTNANNNAATVTGAGSLWTNSNQIVIGYSGSGNALTIANSGTVFSASGYIGHETNANGNAVTVTGIGSAWNITGDLTIGYNGANNHLTIANGGYVEVRPPTDRTTYIGYNESSSNNTVLVESGMGLRGYNLYNDGPLHVGYSGANNSLTITNDGHVYSTSGSIGYNASSSNNTVVLQQAVTFYNWYNEGDLYVGYNGANNSLTLSNHGAVFATNVIVGANSSASNNVFIADSSLLEILGAIDIRNGSFVVNGPTNAFYHVYADSLFATNGAHSVVQFNGGWMELQSATVSNGSPFVIGDGTQTAELDLYNGTSSFANDLILSSQGSFYLATPVTVNVGGSYTQQVLSTLGIEIAGTNTGSYGRINVAGSASLTGTLEIAQGGTYVPHHLDQQVLIIASNGVSGTFSNFVNDIPVSPLVQPNLYYHTNNVTLVWDQLSLTSFFGSTLTPNQRATAGGVDSTGTSSIPGAVALLNYLDDLAFINTNAIPGALDLIAPEELSAMTELAFAGMNARGYSFLSRVNELRAGSHGFNANRLSLYDPNGPGQSLQPIAVTADAAQIYAARAEDPLSASKDNPWGVYLEGNGEFVDIKGDGNSSGYHHTSGGFTVGIDRRIGDEFAIGLTLGYADTTADLANDGKIRVDNGRASLYGAWFKDGVHIEGMLGGGYNSYDTKRTAIDGTAQGNTDGTEFNTLFGGGYDWQKGMWSFGPQLTLQYKYIDIKAFDESGSMAPLHIDDQSHDSLQSRLGGRLGFHKEVKGIIISPEFSVAWQHEYITNDVSLDSRFMNGAGSVFTTSGPTLGRDSVVTGAGVSVQWTKTLGTFLNYATELGRAGYESHNVNGGVAFRF